MHTAAADWLLLLLAALAGGRGPLPWPLLQHVCLWLKPCCCQQQRAAELRLCATRCRCCRCCVAGLLFKQVVASLSQQLLEGLLLALLLLLLPL
jgi:hypothetical protein